MSAPTPVSAYLHSATMVKAGVFLLARLYPALSGTGLWFWVVTAVGLFTLVFGAFFALFKHDLKGLLAYSTISHLGLITMLFGMGTSLSAVAGVFHIINHAIFKASLFMAAGIIEHESGSRDMRQLNGLVSYMPHTALLATVAAAAMAGVPLLNGFLSKEMFFAETLTPGLASHWQGLLPVAAVVSGIFAVAYSLRFIHDVFFNGLPVDLPRQPHEPPRWMRIPVEVLVGLCLLVGVAPHITVEPWLRAAAEAVVPGGAPHFDLALWHGFTTALFMSLVALGGGLAVYSVRRWIFHWHDTLLPQPQVLARFAQAEEALNKGGRRLLALLENGSLQRYVGVLFLTTLAVVALGWWGAPAVPAGPGEGPPPGPGMALNALAMALAAAATVGLQRRRLVALIWLGVVGLGVALVFVRFSAPDLALTQLAVEVVSVVLLLLALYFLPQRPPRDSSASRRLRDGLLAGVAGVAVGALVWGMLAVDTVGVGQRYLAESVPGTGGHNVVNAILVDFRGFDTLGEVTVLGIAAVGVFAMLRGFLLPPAPELQGRAWHRDRHPLVLLTISRPLLPVALLVSLYLLLRGHNAPGGGFVAGLITGIALILQYLASGTNWTQARLRVNYRRLLAAGLGTALVTGLIPWLWGAPFLTSAHGPLHLPLLGDLHWNTALLFDIGVYLTVVGAVTLILAELGWLGQKRRWHTLAEPEPKEGQPWPW
jgi:multicomponent K+:H+ antiporter subunit A